MGIVKLTILAILISMYQIALSDNGIVKAISWLALIGLLMALVARLERLYGEH